MQGLVYLLLLTIFLPDFLNKQGFVPTPVTWSPELVSGVILLIVLSRAVQQRRVYTSPWYLIIFSLLLLNVVCGVIANQVPSGALFAGIRNYFKYFPVFFLPAVYLFSDNEIKQQLKFLLGLSILQLPIAIYQRLVVAGGQQTGDPVQGMLATSSMLSIYLICVFSVLLSFRYKNKLSWPRFLLLAVLVLLPTTINETKGTLFLFPVALLLPIWFVPGNRNRLKQVIGVCCAGLVFVSVYVPTYDYFFSKTGRTLTEFLTSEKHGLDAYLAPRISGKGAKEEDLGKADAVIIALKELSNKPSMLLLGLGIGNVSESFLGERFNGEFYEEFGDMAFVSTAKILWETGIMGFVLLMIFWLRVMTDAQSVKNGEGVAGAVALGWIGVLGVLLFGLFYKEIVTDNVLGFMFWYISGYVAASRMASVGEKATNHVALRAGVA